MNRIGIPLVAGLLALVAGGCVFKGGAADEYRCHSGVCPAGLQCVDGICVAAPDAGSDTGIGDAAEDGPQEDAQQDAQQDAQRDAQQDGQQDAQRDAQQDAQDDAPPQQDAQQDAQDDAPPQQDAQQDVQDDAPPQQDAQEDAAVGCVLDPLTSDAGHFTAVLTSGAWQFGGTGYSQTVSDDLHDTWVSGAGGDHVSIQVVTVPTQQGRPQFNSPPGNFASAVGVIVRASGLTTTSATGYFCGVDLRGQRLLLGRMSGAYSVGNGSFTILGQSAMTVTLNTAYTVRAEAQGSAITCASGSQTINSVDASITTGSVGLFTIGARARFTDAYYCLP